MENISGRLFPLPPSALFCSSMRKSSIQIDVVLDQQNIPEEITWHASDNPGQVEKTKSFALSFWDAESSAIMRIDLWTKDMLVGEMKRFFLQSLGGMNETLQSATNDQEWYDEVEKTIQKLALKLQEQEASEPKG
jgi:gliding motility-associated protein GldC